MKTVSKLTSNNSELTATIKTLTNQLERDLEIEIRRRRRSDICEFRSDR